MCSPASSAWGHADFYPSLPISASCHPSEYQDFFLEVENFQHCSAVTARQSEYCNLWATVEEPVATSFSGLILKGGGCTCNMHGAFSIKCVTRALTGLEAGGELPALGLCRARVCCATVMQCPASLALQADMSRAWTCWSGIPGVWVAFRARQSLRKEVEDSPVQTLLPYFCWASLKSSWLWAHICIWADCCFCQGHVSVTQRWSCLSSLLLICSLFLRHKSLANRIINCAQHNSLDS